MNHWQFHRVRAAGRTAVFHAGLCAMCVLMLHSCQSSKPGSAVSGVSVKTRRQLNVVLLTIDTLRADRLGCYGYSKGETPNLDNFARKGVLFENAAAHTPLTAPSHASMFTGQYPTVHKVRDTGGFVLQASSTTLAGLMQRGGWDTAAFVGASVLKKRFGFGQGFGVYDDQMASSERRAGEVVDRAIQWLDSQSGKPFLLWVHVFDPHLPYDPPSPFREKYMNSPYDGEVAYTDQQLGRLLDRIAKKSPSENTIIAILSDHGESFSEHGEYAHGVFLYDSTLRIPFLIAGPGVPAGLRVKPQARTVDLLPTLLELAGIDVPDNINGTTLTPAFTGKALPTDWSYAETLFPRLNMGWAELRGVRTNQWKYIRSPKPELYDLIQDPTESSNVIADHKAEAQKLEAKLKEVTGGETEKVEPVAVDRQTLKQLRSLGYLGGSSPQQYKMTGKGTDPKDRIDVLKLLHLAVYTNLPLSQRIDLLRQAVAKDPVNPTLYNNLGNLYSEAGRAAETLKLYGDAVSHGIRTAWLYSRLGHLYLQRGNKNEAMNNFENAAQLNPYDFDSLQNLAVIYRDTGRLDDAMSVLEGLLKTGEEYAPAYNELGMVMFQKGDRGKALTYFEKAAQLDATYQLNLGRLYKAMGDNLRARAAFEKFLAVAASRPENRPLMPQARNELAAIPQ